MTQTKVQQRWQHLDPVFIRGMQRSGTTILHRSLQEIGFGGFEEGHLWFDLVVPLARFKKPAYAKFVREEGYALGENRNQLFEKYVALVIDTYHRDNLPAGVERWVDKSPGHHELITLPILLDIFPRSQVIFVYRNAVSTLHSSLKLWQESNPNIFWAACQGWATTMATWRKLAGLMEGRYIIVAQEHISADPDTIAEKLANFLQVPEHQPRLAECFRSRRENTAFLDKSTGDYDYQVDWSDEQKAFFVETCQAEMDAWGYQIDFDRPAGPTRPHPLPADSPIQDRPTYYTWLNLTQTHYLQQEFDTLWQQKLHQAEQERDDLAKQLEQLHQERRQLQDLLERIRGGHLMRALNKVDAILRRLRLR